MPETVNLTTNNLIFALIGSGVIATVVGFILETIKSCIVESKKDSKDRNNNFYFPLKLKLKDITYLNGLTKDVMIVWQDAIDRQDHDTMDEASKSKFDFYQKWLTKVDEIKLLIDSKYKYIKSCDEDIFLRFSEAYSYKQEIYFGTHKFPFSQESYNKASNVQKILEEMTNKFSN